MSRTTIKVPHTLVLLFGMIVLALCLTWILPQGEYERVKNRTGREMVVAGSYHRIELDPLPPTAALTAIPRGFADAQEIIFFVFIIGGALAVLRASGTVDALLGFLLRRLGRRPGWLIAGGILLFAAGSSTIGMAEEYLPFVPLLLALSMGLGFDAVTAVAIIAVGYSIGYGVAVINPFTVIIAQDIAGLEHTSGMWYRLVLFGPFLALGFLHVWRYTRRLGRAPGLSLVADVPPDPEWRHDAKTRFTVTHLCILAAAAAALVLLVVGIKSWHWYLTEMGALFLGLTLLIALVGRLRPDRTARVFCAGAAELTTTALLIGFARTIQIVLNDGHVVDTIIHGVAAPLRSLGPETGAVGMFLVQSLCNFFVCSGSGQAYVTMPIMAPLSDLVGVSRQTAVLAYQFGDGFTNILVPTSPVLMGMLAMARIPYERWLRFILPFILQVTLLGALAMVVAVLVGYS